MVLCPYDGSPLLNTIHKFDDQAETLEIDDGGEVEQRDAQDKLPPSEIEVVSTENSIGNSRADTERDKIPLSLLLWVQLIIANYLCSAVISSWMGIILGVFYIMLLIPVSIIISRLVNRNTLLSILIGGLVAAMIEGGAAYSIREWAARYGIMYGAFFGASLTFYFSKKYKYTNLLWASISTFVLIALIVIPEIAGYGTVFILEMFRDEIGDSLLGAVMTIGMGLAMLPLILPLQRFLEYIMERLVEMYEIWH